MAIQIRRGTDSEWESNKSNIVAGEPAVAMDSERMFVGTGSGTYMELANIDVLADAFDSSTTYAVGDYCTYQGKLYKFTSAHSGAWSGSDAEVVNIAEEMRDDVPSPSNANPQMDGTASAGVSADYSRADHVHPTDTSRASATEVENIRVSADGIAYNSAGVAVRSQIGDLNSTAKVIEDELFSYSSKTVYSTSSGYRLNENNGFCSVNASYKLVKYSVTAGDLIKIVSDDRFQFNDGANVPSSGTSKMIGHTFGTGVFVLKVPDGATYLILSTPSSDSIAVAYNVTSKLNYIVPAIEDVSLPLYKTEISDNTLHPFIMKSGDHFRVKTTDGSVLISGTTIHFYDKDGNQTAYWTLTAGNTSFEATYPSGRAKVVKAQIKNPNGLTYSLVNESNPYNIDSEIEEVKILNYQVLLTQLSEYVPFYAEQGTSVTFKTADGNDFPEHMASVAIYDGNKNQLHYYGLASYGNSRTITIPLTDSAATEYVRFLSTPGAVAYDTIVVNNSSLEAKQDAEVNERLSALEDGSTTSISKKYINNKTLNDRKGVEENSDLNLIFFSDIHAGSTNMERIVEFANNLGTVDAIVNGGDTVQSYVSDTITWYNDSVDDADTDVLTCVGNHDAWSSFYVTADPVDIYNAFIAPVASKVSDIVQPTNAATDGKCYYYKDYDNIRVIVLAAMYYTPSDQLLWTATQKSWLESVLADAITNDKAVICVNHSPFVTAKADIMEESQLNTWQPYPTSPTWDGIVTAQEAVDAVNTFITNGGEFICWLTGHTHRDNLLTETDYENQFMINIASAKYAYHQDGYSPDSTDTSETNYDCFDYIGIDTTNKIIKVWRIGFNQDAAMRVRNRFAYDYADKKLLSGS